MVHQSHHALKLPHIGGTSHNVLPIMQSHDGPLQPRDSSKSVMKYLLPLNSPSTYSCVNDQSTFRPELEPSYLDKFTKALKSTNELKDETIRVLRTELIE